MSGLVTRVRHMKKNKTILYFSSFFLLHILVCCIKLDRNIVVFQEHIGHFRQSYSEQPVPGNIAYFNDVISGLSPGTGPSTACSIWHEETSIWNVIVLLYNSRVRSLLKQTEDFNIPRLSSAVFPHIQDFPFESSDDEELRS
jgi:hypothetical protein